MDECWLDVTGSGCMGTGFEIADEIRRTVKFELGLTISAGVSFNKIFAKLGSDMKKPDAITCIEADSFRGEDLVSSLPLTCLESAERPRRFCPVMGFIPLESLLQHRMIS